MTRVKQIKRLEALERKRAPVETTTALDAELFGAARLWEWVCERLASGGFDTHSWADMRMYDLLELAYARRIASEQEAQSP